MDQLKYWWCLFVNVVLTTTFMCTRLASRPRVLSIYWLKKKSIWGNSRCIMQRVFFLTSFEKKMPKQKWCNFVIKQHQLINYWKSWINYRIKGWILFRGRNDVSVSMEDRSERGWWTNKVTRNHWYTRTKSISKFDVQFSWILLLDLTFYNILHNNLF